jgi:hypothetical protein
VTVTATIEAMPDPATRAAEFVERKGAGHPDTLCDAMAEAVSRALSQIYLARFGRILHHNVDKVLLAAGSAAPRFGGGHVTAPIRIVLAGRATAHAGGEAIDVEGIAVEAARACLAARLRHLDVARDVRFDVRIRPGSAELRALFARAPSVPLANDSSAGAGFAPGQIGVCSASEWAANTPAAHGEHFNLTNGEVFSWRDLWPSITHFFGLELSPDRPLKLAEYLPSRASLWNHMVEKHGLRKLSMAQILGESHHSADQRFGYGLQEPPPPVFVSTVKIKQAGYTDTYDTEQAVKHWLGVLMDRKIIPRTVGP